MQASLIINSVEPIIQMYARAAVYSIVAMGDRRQGHSRRGGRRAVASAWPLMRD